MMGYTSYLHVEKLGSPEVEGILDGHVSVTPKLDGTNAVVWMGEDGYLHAGSRKRAISPSSSKMVGFVLNVAYNDAVLAEMPSIVKKMKMPTIDFKRLHDLSFERVRESIGL